MLSTSKYMKYDKGLREKILFLSPHDWCSVEPSSSVMHPLMECRDWIVAPAPAALKHVGGTSWKKILLMKYHSTKGIVIERMKSIVAQDFPWSINFKMSLGKTH